MLTLLLNVNNGLAGNAGGVLTPTASISGTAAAGLTETEVVDGGKTIIITLANETWVAAGATFNAQRQNIIDGLDSDQSEATGWNAEVRDKEVVTSVARTSDTVVTITLSAAAAYDVTADETITATVPGTAVTGAMEITGSPTFDVTADVAPAPTPSGSAGGGTRHFGASYDYNEPEVIAAREEIKVLRQEKRKVRKQDNSLAMLDAIEARLKFLYQLLEEKKAGHIRTQERYEYEAKMKEAKREKREKRMRRLKTIARLLN